MRTLLIIGALLLVACKESGGEKAALVDYPGCSNIVDVSATDIWDSPNALEVLIDSGSLAVGNCIAQQGDYAWVQDSVDPQYYYAVNITDGSLRQSQALVYADAGCTTVLGEVFDYPLHLGGDVYVFEFEGVRYEYHLLGALGLTPGTYYSKTAGGVCGVFTGDQNLVREIQPSPYARVFTGPVDL